MQFIRASLSQLPVGLSPCVVTIGNFDGIHRGHQLLVHAAKEQAALQGLPAVVMSFNPYPKAFFLKGAVPRLMQWREQFTTLEAYGIDYFIQWRFNAAFAALSASAFIEKILLGVLQARVVIVGDDFRFGAKRQGDDAMLMAAGQRDGFQVIQIPTLSHAGQRISSTRIRETLQAGDMVLVKALLGRYYSICGTVCHGDKLGRQLGFPTANIAVHRRLVPLSGVFVVAVTGIDDKVYQGVANIGTRPAVRGTRVLLEVYLFDFDREIYGCHITVSFLHKLREEADYPTLDALKSQIAADVSAGRNFLSLT